MNYDNICKFTSTKSGDLICANMVYETTDIQSTVSTSAEYVLGLVTEGFGTLTEGSETFEISNGYAFFINKGARFSIKGDKSLEYFYVTFSGRRGSELVLRYGLSETRCTFDLKRHYDELKNFITSSLVLAREANTDVLAECALLYVLAHLDTRKREENDLLSTMISITNKEFQNSQFSLSTLSDMLGYNAKYLSFFFKKKKGVCYSDYLRELRIKHSVFLIEEGISSVKNLALLSGFTDALYFSKTFKKEMGTPPTEYIESYYSKKALSEVN